MDYQQYLKALRKACKDAKVEIEGGQVIGTHSLRRGAAQSMADMGGRLCEILDAGDWSSKAFMDYMDKSKIEREALTCIIADAELEEEEEVETDSDSEADSEFE